jgi:Icc protein
MHVARALRLVQITDTHLMADAAERLLAIDTDRTLCAVLVRVARERPDVLLMTGDLAQDGTAESYRRLAEHVRGVAPVAAWVPGNHDDPGVMAAALAGPGIVGDRVLDVGDHWRLLLLDSVRSGAVEGYLDAQRLGALAADLGAATAAGRHVAVVLHHPPLPTGSWWLDAILLHEPEHLLAVLDAWACVRFVLAGHVHQESRSERRGVTWLTAPSTCFQFLPGAESFACDNLAPGYRVVDLDPAGTFSTRVVRVAEAHEPPDPSVKGY